MEIDPVAKIRNFVLVIIGTCTFILITHNSITLENFLVNNFNLLQLNYLTKIFVIIFSLIVLNTSYYSFFSHKRKRMLYFVVIFGGIAFIEILSGVFYNNLFVEFSVVTLDLFNIYYELAFMVFGLILMVASIVDIEDKFDDKYMRVLKITPVIEIVVMILLVYLVMSSYQLSINSEILILFARIIQFSTLTIAIVMYLKLYYQKKNLYVRYFASGLVIILIMGIYKYLFLINEYHLFIASILFVVGLGVLNHATFRYNIGIPYLQLLNAKRQIVLYTENLEKIVEKRTKEIAEVNEKLVSEIESAKRIQQSILPVKRIELENTLFISEFIPCQRLSGDFYDVYEIDKENIGMYILDVSGHGISAALMTMFCNNYIRSSERLIKRYRGLKPHRNIQHFYDEFNKMNFPDEMHMVIFFASYNIKTRILKYSNGGMNNFPIIFRKNGKVEKLDKNIGFPICKMSEIYIPEYVSSYANLEVGDRVLFFTDGLVDEKKNQIMNEEELIEGFINHKDDALEVLNKALVNKIYETEKEFEDDITYLIMEIQ